MSAMKRSCASILICLSLFGCGFFDAGTKKLNEYCPSLNVDIYNFNETIGSSKRTWILWYHHSFQQKIDDYFSNKSNGFTNQSWLALMNKRHEVNSKIYGDSVLAKTMIGTNHRTLIIYDKPVHRIIVIEQLLK